MISRGDFWFNKKAYWNKCDGGGDNQIKGAPRWTWHWMLRKNKWQIKMQIKRKNRKGTKRGTDKSSPRPETSTQCTLFRGTLAHWSKKKNKTKQKTKQDGLTTWGTSCLCLCCFITFWKWSHDLQWPSFWDAEVGKVQNSHSEQHWGAAARLCL